MPWAPHSDGKIFLVLHLYLVGRYCKNPTSTKGPVHCKSGPRITWLLSLTVRVLQPPYKFKSFFVAASTLAQVEGFAQKPFWSSFVKICECLGVAQ